MMMRMAAASSSLIQRPIGGVRGIRGIHYARRSPPAEEEEAEASPFNIDTTAIPTAEEEEWATPPAIMTMQTPGHGRGADLYSQRRGLLVSGGGGGGGTRLIFELNEGLCLACCKTSKCFPSRLHAGHWPEVQHPTERCR